MATMATTQPNISPHLKALAQKTDVFPLPDSLNSFVDLSGTATPVRRGSTAGKADEEAPTFDNPYNVMIHNCSHNPSKIQEAYNTHRTTRNSLSRHKLLTDPTPIKLDYILLKSHVLQDGTIDHRNCLVFWARPPLRVRNFIATVQDKLRAVAPNLWLMPPPNLHTTVLEITHSRTPEYIADLVKTMRPSLQSIVDHTYTHRAKLVKPMLSFDGSACAISFVPAAPAGEGKDNGKDSHNYNYTYHHLRRDLYDLSKESGVEIDSRYTVPSAHITIARFITTEDHVPSQLAVGETAEPEAIASATSILADSSQPDLRATIPAVKIEKSKMEKWVESLDEINQWLSEYEGDGAEWIVGEEKGLDCRIGRLWYGGGETVVLGKGI
ncbi:transport between ER and Golgi ATPase protein [Orbilia oligospora]|uniref:Transport between ER and Golgi ATPase protein n=2 Tax=Orbilia oligospora TaxID=2813651 RepID=A0A8H8UR98_ORBOL|nr:transport between ER and Golgi ATPase protein [Orbilia oligospora]